VSFDDLSSCALSNATLLLSIWIFRLLLKAQIALMSMVLFCNMIISMSSDCNQYSDGCVCKKSSNYLFSWKCAVQELSNILESLASQRASSGTADADDGMEADMVDDGAPEDADDADADAEAEADDQPDDVSAGRAIAGLLQTFVFSATLTLPEKLRKRLRRGVNLVMSAVQSEGWHVENFQCHDA